jgi:hypothetical protein
MQKIFFLENAGELVMQNSISSYSQMLIHIHRKKGEQNAHPLASDPILLYLR